MASPRLPVRSIFSSLFPKAALSRFRASASLSRIALAVLPERSTRSTPAERPKMCSVNRPQGHASACLGPRAPLHEPELDPACRGRWRVFRPPFGAPPTPGGANSAWLTIGGAALPGCRHRARVSGLDEPTLLNDPDILRRRRPTFRAWVLPDVQSPPEVSPGQSPIDTGCLPLPLGRKPEPPSPAVRAPEANPARSSEAPFVSSLARTQ